MAGRLCGPAAAFGAAPDCSWRSAGPWVAVNRSKRSWVSWLSRCGGNQRACAGRNAAKRGSASWLSWATVSAASCAGASRCNCSSLKAAKQGAVSCPICTGVIAPSCAGVSSAAVSAPTWAAVRLRTWSPASAANAGWTRRALKLGIGSCGSWAGGRAPTCWGCSRAISPAGIAATCALVNSLSSAGDGAGPPASPRTAPGDRRRSIGRPTTAGPAPSAVPSELAPTVAPPTGRCWINATGSRGIRPATCRSLRLCRCGPPRPASAALSSACSAGMLSAPSCWCVSCASCAASRAAKNSAGSIRMTGIGMFCRYVPARPLAALTAL